MRTVTVTGSGTAQVVPDAAVLRVSAVHRADSLTAALSGAESARAAAVSAAGELVVSTVNVSVWPVYEEDRRVGFEARHSLTIAVDDVAAAGQLLGTLGGQVGDRLQVEGVELTPRDPSAALGEAREAAFGDARAKAEHLAALAGATLDRVETVVEGGGWSPAPFAVAAKADVGLQPGVSTVAASVTVTWSLA